MGISLQRDGFVDCNQLVDSIVADMVAHGFVQKFPVSAYTPSTDTKATLEAGPTVDPLNSGANPQPWRIHLAATNMYRMDMYVGHALQLADNGSVANLEKIDGVQNVSGILGDALAPEAAYTDIAEHHFVDRTRRLDENSIAAYPMSYQLTISNRGFALCVWEADGDIAGNRFSWVVVQRSVDSVTGAPYITGKSPVWCVYSLKNNIYKRVVRESDILKPSLPKSATVNSEDNRAIINAESMVSISEDNKYVVMFPNGLNTARHSYTQELDLIGYTSADVVSQYSEVPLTVYGEATPRIYKALNANKPNNTGMRILMLTQSADVTPQA